MKELVVVGTDYRVRVDVDAELLEKEVNVGVELWLPSLAQEYKNLSSVLQKVLEWGDG